MQPDGSNALHGFGAEDVPMLCTLAAHQGFVEDVIHL